MSGMAKLRSITKKEEAPLTLRQSEALLAVKQLTAEKGYSPTIRELATALSVSLRTSQEFLIILKRKGYIDWLKGSNRTIRVLKDG